MRVSTLTKDAQRGLSNVYRSGRVTRCPATAVAFGLGLVALGGLVWLLLVLFLSVSVLSLALASFGASFPFGHRPEHRT